MKTQGTQCNVKMCYVEKSTCSIIHDVKYLNIFINLFGKATKRINKNRWLKLQQPYEVEKLYQHFSNLIGSC